MSASRKNASVVLFVALATLPSLSQLNGERGSNKNLTPLMIASRNNDVTRVREILAHGANVNERANTGETALYEAIEWLNTKHDNLPTVDLILKAGADPNERAIFNATPLDLSLTRDHLNPSVTLRLIQAGSTVPKGCDGQDGVVSLATQDSSIQVIAALISAGASPNCQNTSGMTPLHWAAINGQADRAKVLLNSGADPSLRNQEGKTPLDEAITTNPDKRVQKDFAETRTILKSGKTRQS